MDLQCANTWNSIWKYMATCVNQELNISVDNLYLKLNKELDNVQEQKKCPRQNGHTYNRYYILHTHTHSLLLVDF